MMFKHQKWVRFGSLVRRNEFPFTSVNCMARKIVDGGNGIREIHNYIQENIFLWIINMDRLWTYIAAFIDMVFLCYTGVERRTYIWCIAPLIGVEASQSRCYPKFSSYMILTQQLQKFWVNTNEIDTEWSTGLACWRWRWKNKTQTEEDIVPRTNTHRQRDRQKEQGMRSNSTGNRVYNSKPLKCIVLLPCLLDTW